MEFNEQQTQQLSQPINPDNVSFREGGGGLKLAYVESWHVIQRLIESLVLVDGHQKL